MKGFTKLALVSAIAALPMTGFAMEALDDATMSDVTGQDGISIGLSLNQSMTIVIDDTDGLLGVAGAPAAATADGIIQIGDGAGAGTEMSMNGTATINVDAGGDGTDGVLVVGISLASGFAVNTGDISVGTSINDGALTGGAPVLDSVGITFTSGLDLNIQLGAAADQFLEITNGNIGTLNITNFALNDINGGGAISATNIALTGLDLTGLTGSLTANGLELSTNGALAAVGVEVTRLSLDDGATFVGDIYISGLNMSGQTITINGK